MSTAELHLSNSHSRTRVIVDGHDIGQNITGLTLTAEPGRAPRLEISLRIVDITALADEYTVLRIDAGTVALLRRCGWIAPDGEPTVLRPRAGQES